MVIVREILKSYLVADTVIRYDIDSAIEYLAERGDLSERQLQIVNGIKEYSVRELAELLGIHKRTVEYNLNKACSKIADYLGESYQDSKLIVAAEARLGRKLTPEEEKACWYIIRNYGNRRVGRINIFNFKIEDGQVVFNGRREDKK